MRTLLKFLAFVLTVALVVVGSAWVYAGRMAGPAIDIRQPEKFIGQSSTLEVMIEAPEGRFSHVDIAIEQIGQTYPVFALGQPAADVKQESADRIYIMRPVGKQAIPELRPGKARIVARAARSVLYGLREIEATATRDVEVRLEPPRVSVLSTHHYVNHGGADLAVYRVTPPDVESGVRVGDLTYPGFPASGAGIGSDASTRVALFALLDSQDLNTPVSLYARDEAGNEVTATLEHRPFPKPFARSRIELTDGFLQRVVPAIASNTPQLTVSTPPNDLLESFLKINGELRRQNNETIAMLARKTSPQMHWKDAFQQLGNSQVESRFADNRAYFYQGKEVDRQVHLGFDLAVTANVPVAAAQHGDVVFADYLGIYGNCVVVDHGLGVQSLYAHLSSIDVKPGDRVAKGQTLGRSGMTGLAGGDHLHFTMLLNGQAVNPVEWWDPKWMEDRILRKLRDAGATADAP